MANLILGTFGDDTLVPVAAGDSLVGLSGNDTYVLAVSGSYVIEEQEGGGRDTVRASFGFVLPDFVEDLVLVTLTGGSTSNNFNATGNALDNRLTGNAGNNVLDGLAGNDTLEGGAGDDTYAVSAAGDVVIENAGEGNDVVNASIAWTLGANIERLQLTGFGNINGTGNELANTITGNSGANLLLGFAGDDSLSGGSGNDTAEGGVGNDTLLGGFGDDRLVGGAGNDSLDGGAGVNVLLGGVGDDTYVVNGTDGQSTITEAAGGGNDSVRTDRAVFVLPEQVENLTGTAAGGQALTGNGLANVLTGGSGADSLSGGAGNDLVRGGAGADTLSGGAGDDTYVVEDLGDVVVEAAGGGVDRVLVNINGTPNALYVATPEVERIDLVTGSDTTRVRGNASDNLVNGNGADNTLEGLAGNDRLDGGAGNDTLFGGTGSDTYVLDSAGDLAIEASGDAASRDRVLFNGAGDYALGEDFEDLVLGGTASGGTGNALGNRITGNERANLLDGGAGVDTLEGGAGNDTYLVTAGDVITEAADSGNDLVRASASYTLGANLERLELAAGAFNGTGNALSNTITALAGNNRLDGGAGDDALSAGEGADTLLGGAGNDELDGGAGGDSMDGGAGDDTFIVDNALDTVVERAGQGSADRVDISAVETFDMSARAAQVEWGVLSDAAGTVAKNVIGNGVNNVIVGNRLANRLEGGAGNDVLASDDILTGTGTTFDDGVADTLVGGAGDDIYLVTNAGDALVELDRQGTDLVRSLTTSFTLPSFVENAELRFNNAASNLAGNGLANVLTGNDFANRLEGAAGNDTLAGFGGDDTLDGGAGSDVMEGGAGNDVYVVNVAADRVLEAAGGGTDTVLLADYAPPNYVLGANLENARAVSAANTANPAAGAIRITGNALGNALTGGVGNDTLDGAAGDDSLSGGAGNDSIVGGAGNDTLEGGGGTDTLAGGAGNDVYRLEGGDEAVEAAGAGTDTVVLNPLAAGYTLGANIENLTIGILAASNFVVNGNGLDNRIEVNGTLGADTASTFRLDAGGGNDTVVVAQLGGDSIAGGQGVDLLDATVSVATAVDLSGFEAMILRASGTGAVSGTLGTPASLTLTGAGSLSLPTLALPVNPLVLSGYSGTLTLGLTGAAGADDTLRLQLSGASVTLVEPASGGATDGVVERLFLESAAGANTVEMSGMAGIPYARTAGDRSPDVTITGNANLSVSGLHDSAFVRVTQSNMTALALSLESAALSLPSNLTVLLDGAVIETLTFGNGTGVETVTLEAAAGAGFSRVNVAGLPSGGANSILNVAGSGSLDVRGVDSAVVNVSHTGVSAVALESAAQVSLAAAGRVTVTGSSGADTLLGREFLNDQDAIDLGGGTDTLSAVINGLESASTGRLRISNVETQNYTVGDGAVASLDGTAMGTQTHNIAGGGALPATSVTIVNGIGTWNASGYTGKFQASGFTSSFFGNITVTGSAGNDTIDGSGSSTGDNLDGGAGNDTMRGLGGNDTIAGGAGSDTVSGDAGADSITGGAGADSLDGGAGADSLDGGEDADTVSGGEDNDTVSGGLGDDSLSGGAGNDSLVGGGGNDTLLGNEGNDTLTGGDGNDSLTGGAGIDAMTGGLGNDTFVLDVSGDTVSEASGEGTDLIQIAFTAPGSFSLVNAANVENATVTAAFAVTLTGNILDNALTGNTQNDTLLGGDGNDTLSGAEGSDSLTGGDGNDSLDGGAGADALAGGLGNDTYVLDAEGDTVSEAASAGTDVVRLLLAAGAGFDMAVRAANVENVEVGGASGLSVSGNDLDNRITGGDGADTLSGGAGGDTLAGGEGNDTLTGGDGNDSLTGGAGIDAMTGGLGNDTFVLDVSGDTVSEASGEGTDLIQIAFTAPGSFSLVNAANVENATVTVAVAVTLNGNALDNVLTGNTQNDSLSGGEGNDTLVGAEGNDTVSGDAGADSITGGAGADSLDGGAGADLLSGGAGADVFVFSVLPGAGQSDTLSDFAGAEDQLAFAATVFAGLGAAGPLDPSLFLGAASFADVNTAGTAGTLLKYAASTGELYFDADGSGAGAAVLVATLTGAPALTAADVDVL